MGRSVDLTAEVPDTVPYLYTGNEMAHETYYFPSFECNYGKSHNIFATIRRHYSKLKYFLFSSSFSCPILEKKSYDCRCLFWKKKKAFFIFCLAIKGIVLETPV